ncbi:MAG: T9SS type A sorting domain-containing protein [Phycisphaerae bacterium]|nr:T9SS type A sorting domain-containing protein [Saprospiraceae bacterium]
MKHRLTLLFAFLFLTFFTANIFSQNTFQKTIGGDGDDFANWVVEIPTGYIIAGQAATPNNLNACLLQLDHAGNIIWQKNYGAGYHFNVVVDAGNGFLALGESNAGASDVDIFLVRTDLTGNVLWSKQIGDTSTTDLGNSLVAVPGGYLLSGAQAPTGTTSFNSIFTRLDANGNTLWSRTYSSGSIGNLIRSNYVENNVIYASGAAETSGAFLRLDLMNGDVLGSATYDGNSTEALYYQQPTLDSNLVIADHTRSAAGNNEIRLWVQKITKPTGQIIWSKVYNKSSGVDLRGRIEIADGGFLLTPYNDSSTPANDGMLAKIDPNGNVLWSYQYGGNQEDRLLKATQTADGGFVAVGHSRSNSVNGDNDIFIVKTDSNGLVTGCCTRPAGIEASNFSATDISLSYDPSNSYSADSIGIDPVSVNLLTESLCASIPPIDSQDVTLCPNQTFTLNGIDYHAPTVVYDTIPSSGGGCDTIRVYNLLAAPYDSVSQLIQFCFGDTITIGGQVYTQSATVVDTISSAGIGCDTIVTYTLEALLHFSQNDTIPFCPGDSITIGGQVYTQSATVVDTLFSTTGSCDTLLTYTLILLPEPTLSDTIQFCPGDSITIAGQVFTQSATVIDTILSTGGACDTIVTYTLILLPQPTLSDTIQFCPGDSITISGQVYTQSATVVDTISSTGGACDTIATYTLILLPQPTLSDTIQFCPGDSITIAGQVYTQSATVVDTISSIGGACDTIATYTLILLPQPTLSDTIEFCPGETITIGAQGYTQSATVVDTIPALGGGCDTIATYTLVLLPQPLVVETIGLCFGDTVTINGVNYTQPGNVLDTIPAIGGGCDTIVSYVLVSLTPAPSVVNIHCPNDLSVITLPGTGPTVATYNLPTVTTDCPCPGTALTLTAGLASGSIFPVVTTQVCYSATDSCGNSASCCFSVTIREELPCDEKVVACMKYEVLSITKNAGGKHTYHIRATNNCANKMIWTAIQVPDGLTADDPLNGTVYTTPDGRKYDVRNPNFSPFYSVRFKSTTDSISNGQSDIFKYTLPAQAGNLTYIHIASRLTGNVTYEAHLNTFNCPITVMKPAPQGPRSPEEMHSNGTLQVFPNPTSGILFADLTDWRGEQLQVEVFNSQGQLAQSLALTANGEMQQIALPNGIADGLYFLQILTENGERQTVRFVLQH